MTIPKITPYSGGVANPDGSQTQTEFTQNMFDQLSYEAQLAAQLDATIDGMNNAVDEVEANASSAENSANAAEAAASGLNYKGLWPDTGGSANKGDTYQTQVSGTGTGQYFTALQSTTVDPVSDDVNWREVVSNQSLGRLTNYQAASVADMIAGNTVSGLVSIESNQVWETLSYNVEVTSKWKIQNSVPQTHTLTINAIDVGSGLYAVLLSDDGDVRHCGAGLVAVADEGPLWNASIKHVNKAFLPKQSASYAREIELDDYTYLKVEGSLRHTPNSPEWSRVLTNKDRVRGNKGFTIDFTGGEAHGNQANQPEVNQHYFLFINCVDCTWVGGTLKENRALNDDASEIPLTPHPDGPFTQGVKRGEPSYTEIDSGFGYWIGGKNNHALGGINLLNWQKEGFSMRWVDTSSIGQIEGISGPEVNYSEYVPVDWTTRAGTQSIAIGDHVLVQDGYEYNGEEQQPHLIYESLITGSIDLGNEDYTDSARWSLVLRDISEDYGYTVARITGSTVGQNAIYDAKGSFCRASTFSNDSEQCVMDNLTSYHNPYNVGINFGHENSPTNGSRASNLISINAGWKGGTGGNSYGINAVSKSDDISIDGFYVSGAGRNGLNVSDNANRVKAANGTVKFSGAGGIKASNAQLDLVGVTSKYNIGKDFEPSGSEAIISLNNCRDTRNVLLNNERLVDSSRSGQAEWTWFNGDQGKARGGWRDSFSTPAGSPIVKLIGLGVSSDSMHITAEYSERNSGSSSAANQRACKATFLVSGIGSNRTVQTLVDHFQLNRKFRAEWSDNSLSIYLQDLVPVDVAANASSNWVEVEIKNHGYQYELEIG